MLTRTPRPLSDRARGLGWPSCECGNKNSQNHNEHLLSAQHRFYLLASPIAKALNDLHHVCVTTVLLQSNTSGMVRSEELVHAWV